MKQKLLNLKSLLLLLLMTVSMGARAQAVYNSLSELAEAIEAGNVAQASEVSVSFNNEITEIRPEMTSQSIVLKEGNYTFQLTANALCDEEWKVGGKLATKAGKKWTAWYSGIYQPTGSDKIYILYNSADADAAWDNLTYTAPENYTLSGLAGAANAENVKNGEMVSVSLNNEITEIKFENQTQFVVVKDGDYTFQLTANAHCSTDWKVGGKLVGDNWIARYLGSYSLNGVDRIHMLYNNADDAWDNLTYTAPVQTYEFFEDLLGAPSYDYVNVNNVYDVVAECEEVHADTYEVKLKNSGISLIITTKDLGWVAGGTVTGSLSNVGWDKDYRFIYLNSTEGLQYIAPFNSLSELAEAAKTGKIGPGTMVSVSLNNEIIQIDEFDKERNMQFVVVKDGDYTFDLVAMGSCGEEWKVGGTLATKEGENWTAIISWYKENNYNLYNSAANAWGNLEYTAPTTISITTPEGYSTFVSDKNIVMPKELKGSAAIINDGELSFAWEYPAGSVVPANTPILVKGQDGKKDYKATVTDHEGTAAPVGNRLFANTTSATMDASAIATDAAKFYTLSYDKNDQNLGFYWRNSTGASFTVPAGKVFLAVPAGAQAKMAFVLTDDDVTGIDAVKVENAENAVMYNLAGQRVNANAKGIVIVNGKKIVNK